MSDETALVPIDQRTVQFYEDKITAAMVDAGGRQVVVVPVRPLCDFLGVDWSSQRQRINRDPVLSDVMMSVVITTTDIDPENRRPRTSVMACLPLDFVNGWLFGVSAARVKEDVRERLIRYQRECYRVLADAFLGGGQQLAASSPAAAALWQVREMGLAIARMAEEQILFDQRLTTTEGRIDRAATVVGDLTRRVTSLETKLAPAGDPVTDDQASQIGQAVKAVAIVLGKQSGRSEFGAVYGELYRKFQVTSYKMIPAGRFREVMDYLTDMYQQIASDDVPF
jgi:hypothetical protein